MTVTMTTLTIESGDEAGRPDTAGETPMTKSMRDGQDGLQREYAAFVEASFKTLALISDWRCRRS